MANVLKHRFASGKTDGADASQVQPSHWNDGHAFTGGNAGDVLTRDPTDASYGATWRARASYVQVGSETVITLPGDQMDYFVTIFTASPGLIYGASASSGALLTGARLRLLNVGAGAITLAPSSTAVSAGQRFLNLAAGQGATRLRGVATGVAGGSATYLYDGNQWRLLAHEQGGAISLGFSNANLVGFTSANIAMQDFYVHGRDLHVRFYFGPATVATPVAALQITGFPWSFDPSSGHLMPAIANFTPAYAGWGINFVDVAADRLTIKPQSFGNWPAGDVYVSFDITVPIL